jgi:F-type H+-transporting ATPase subunit b
MIAAKIELVQPLIGFNGGTIVAVLVTFIVLLLVLKRFFWDKVRAFMQAREQRVIDEFDNAAEVNRVANERLGEYEAKIAAIKSERREMLTGAKRQADENAKEIIRQAEEKAQQIVAQAGEQIEYEKERALADMREQIGMLAVYAAEKIIERQLDPASQQAIVDDVLKEAEGSAWKI